MTDFFNPQIMGGTAPVQMPDFGVPPEQVQPAPQPAPPPPKQVFVPVPVMVEKPRKPKGMSISVEAARKAQGLYPQEQAQKGQMMDRATQSLPTPSGAWGAAK